MQRNNAMAKKEGIVLDYSGVLFARLNGRGC